MSNEKKKLSFLVITLVLLIAIAFFILTRLGSGEEAEPVVPEDEVAHEHEDEGDIHKDEVRSPVVFDESPDKATISNLTLSEPVTIKEAFNPESSTDFKGSFKDERLYVMGAKGQFYHYNFENKQTFTYENLVEDAYVDHLTGDVVLTREIEGSGGKIGVYKALKSYPDRVLIHEGNADMVLEGAGFFKGNVVLNLFDMKTRKASAVVKPLASDTLNGVGQGLAKSMNGNQFNFATDGNRLFAYDLDKNAVVELTTGTPVVFQKFDQPVNNVFTGVNGKDVIVSFVTLSDGKGYTYINGKQAFDQNFAEIAFYDNEFAFVRNDTQSFLMDLRIPDVTPLTQSAKSLSVTPNSLYFVTEMGDIQKIGIKKSAE